MINAVILRTREMKYKIAHKKTESGLQICEYCIWKAYQIHHGHAHVFMCFSCSDFRLRKQVLHQASTAGQRLPRHVQVHQVGGLQPVEDSQVGAATGSLDRLRRLHGWCRRCIVNILKSVWNIFTAKTGASKDVTRDLS